MYTVGARDAAGATLASVPVQNPFGGSLEVFPEQPGEPIVRVDVARPRGAFTVVVPASAAASQVALVRVAPAQPSPQAPAGITEVERRGEPKNKAAKKNGEKEIKSGEVSIGTKVRLRDIDANQTVEYHIVGSAEADPAEHKLSNESPVGKAIMGRKKGDTVEVAAPRGKLKFKIMDIKAA